MSAQEWPWALVIAHECCWCHCATLMIAHGYSWEFMSTREHSIALMNKSLLCKQPSLMLMSIYEHSVLMPIPLIHIALASYLPVLISVHESSWVLFCVHEYSLVILNVQILKSITNKKWLPSCILAMSWSKYQQMITKWIFLEYAGKGLLKNVQEGQSRQLGGKETQKTKFT